MVVLLKRRWKEQREQSKQVKAVEPCILMEPCLTERPAGTYSFLFFFYLLIALQPFDFIYQSKNPTTAARSKGIWELKKKRKKERKTCYLEPSSRWDWPSETLLLGVTLVAALVVQVTNRGGAGTSGAASPGVLRAAAHYCTSATAMRRRDTS